MEASVWKERMEKRKAVIEVDELYGSGGKDLVADLLGGRKSHRAWRILEGGRKMGEMRGYVCLGSDQDG